MEYKKDEEIQSYPLVLIIANESFFAVKLFRQLENKFCRPLIVTETPDKFYKKIDPSFIKNISDYKNNPQADYVLCVNIKEDSGIAASVNNNLLINVKDIAENCSAKTLFLFNYFLNEKDLSDVNNLYAELFNNEKLCAGLIFVGDYLTTEKELNNPSEIYSNFITIGKDKRSIVIPEKDTFYFTNTEVLTENVIRNLFSLRAYGKRSALISKPTTLKEIFAAFEANIPRIKIEINKEGIFPAVTDEKIFLPTNFQESKDVVVKFLEYYVSTIQNDIIIPKLEIKPTQIIKTPETPLIKSEKTKDKLTHKKITLKIPLRNIFTRYNSAPSFINGINLLHKKSIDKNLNAFFSPKFAVLITSIFFLLPLTFVLLSIILFNFGRFLATRTEPSVSDKILEGSLVSSLVVRTYSQYPSRIPVLGLYFKELERVSIILEKMNEVSIRSLAVTNNFYNLFKDITQGKKYDPIILHTTYIELDYIYNMTGFIEAELKNNSFSMYLISKITNSREALIKHRQNVYMTKRFVEFIPTLLGKEKPFSLAILIQDNNKLRPTGGKIESIGLATFTGGELVDFKLYDTDEIDSVLQGVIDPPVPLKKYFASTSWNFKDANWDPDFPTTAAKTEWFVDKAIDKSVDGVIAVNSNFISELKLKNQDDKDKFAKAAGKAGSIETDKGAILGMSSDFYKNINFTKTVNYFSEIYEAFDKRDIQFFVNDNKGFQLLSDIGWDGSIMQESCQGNCYSDYLSINEFVSEGSNSKDIIRQASISVSLEQMLIKRKLVYFLENKSDVSYKTYMRIMVPSNAGFGQVKVINKDKTQEITPEITGSRGFKDAGLYIEIKPKDTVALMFTWENGVDLTFKNDGEYLLTIRPQSGIDSFPADISIEKPPEVKIFSQPAFSLTEANLLGYNTNLAEDFFSRLIWKNNYE